MGGMSAMSSIDRVLEKHHEDLTQRMMENVPDSLRPMISSVSFENEVYSVRTFWIFRDGNPLPGPEWNIDTLAEDYPDCEVGY